MITTTLPPATRCLITFAFVAIVIALSAAPGRTQPGDSIFSWLVAETPNPLQKTMHVLTYATVAWLWAWTLEPIESRTLRMIFALVLAVGIGAALEWYQTTVPGRFGTLTDIALNTLGAILGLLAFWVYSRNT